MTNLFEKKAEISPCDNVAYSAGCDVEGKSCNEVTGLFSLPNLKSSSMVKLTGLGGNAGRLFSKLAFVDNAHS